MIKVRSLSLYLILWVMTYSAKGGDELFKDKAKYLETCPVEMIETFIQTGEKINKDDLEDPLVACNNIHTNCCSKEVFTQGYNQFNYGLRKPIVEQIDKFRDLQKLLYNFSIYKFENTLKEIGEGYKAQCIADLKDTIHNDLFNVKLEYVNIEKEFTDIYNFILRKHSGIICAACNSKFKRSIVKEVVIKTERTHLVAVVDPDICSASFENNIRLINLVRKILPLFKFTKLIKCLSEDPEDFHIMIDLEDLQKREDF